MKLNTSLAILIIALLSHSLHARTLYMGPEEKFTTMEEIEEIIQDGDILEIVPGTYRQCTILYGDNITIRPKGWPNHSAKVRFQDVSCEGKGIFVLEGDNFRIDALEFVNSKVPDRNGAGIRFNGKRLSIYDSYFYKNEMGILTNSDGDGEIIIESSVFESNGNLPPHWGHGAYVGDAKQLRITNSLFIKQKTGHHIKSRALYTEVKDSEIADGMEGNASYSIDISNGGNALIENNIIQKGPLSENTTTAICIACEGGTNPGNSIVVKNNKFTNNTASSRVVFLRNLTSTEESLQDNILKGNKSVLLSNSFPDH